MGAKPTRDINHEFMLTFSAYLRWKRAQRQLTQEAMAELSGFGKRYFSRLCRGEHLPSRDTAHRIGEAIDDVNGALLAAGYLPFPGYELHQSITKPRPEKTLWDER